MKRTSSSLLLVAIISVSVIILLMSGQVDAFKKKKFLKKLVKASLIGKALGSKHTKIIIPFFMPFPVQ
jgi:hypothetical protein